MAPGDFEWGATGGMIESDGVFTAGPDEGNFVITAKTGEDITGSAGVIVAKERKTKSASQATGHRKLTWSGEVAPQKWSNFYMKVLTKLVSGGDLKLRVSIEATPKDRMTDQQTEEIKAALRGLGLDDNIETQ